MLDIEYNSRFIKLAKKLPLDKQAKLADLIELLSENPFHQKLHSKPLSGKLIGFYSFRIAREWRVIFQFKSSKNIILLLIGHRKDIYKKSV